MTDEEYIDIAIEVSKKAPYSFGAIIVKDGKIIGRSDDNTLIAKSIFNHAELQAIESASQNKNLYGKLTRATLYTSCEPCMMCLGAILQDGISKIVYAATIKNSNDYYSPEMMTNIEGLTKIGNSNIEIIKELHREKAVIVLKSYQFKPKNRILITGAILSTENTLTDIYQTITSWIDTKKHTISTPLDTMKFHGNDFEKYQRAMNLLQDTELMIAEMSNISTGQGLELQEATNLNIPVLVIAKTGSKISSLVKGNKIVKNIIYYNNIEDIKNDILEFIKEKGKRRETL